MARVKNKISGKRISPNRIKIVDMPKGELAPGQKVLLYQATGRDIVAATGRVIGQKERILGIGEVKAIEDQLIVELPRKKINSAYRISPSKLSVIGVAKGTFRAKPLNTAKWKNDRVLIKAIEE